MANYLNRPLDPTQQYLVSHGSPVYLGTIVSTTTKNNADTAAPFAIPAGAALLLVPTAAVQFAPRTTSAGTVTTTNGVPLTTGQHFRLVLGNDEAYVACVGAASTAVFQLK